MVSLFLLLGCNLSYIVDFFAALHELASASARTLLKLASSVRALVKPYGDTLNRIPLPPVLRYEKTSTVLVEITSLILTALVAWRRSQSTVT